MKKMDKVKHEEMLSYVAKNFESGIMIYATKDDEIGWFHTENLNDKEIETMLIHVVNDL